MWETRTCQQVAQLLDSYMTMVMMILLGWFTGRLLRFGEKTALETLWRLRHCSWRIFHQPYRNASPENLVLSNRPI
jgi:hypothetical protein